MKKQDKIDKLKQEMEELLTLAKTSRNASKERIAEIARTYMQKKQQLQELER